ncbi:MULTISPECIES: hypothetical protein [unclassified Streptomyces]|uniref:hypothetical protein n=1 Tax=unclassified Streptomyces TaxID=2593676 RepID=UPI0019062EA9|nr:hypothetical protein [Streptomyces sp. HSG2]
MSTVTRFLNDSAELSAVDIHAETGQVMRGTQPVLATPGFAVTLAAAGLGVSSAAITFIGTRKEV